MTRLFVPINDTSPEFSCQQHDDHQQWALPGAQQLQPLRPTVGSLPSQSMEKLAQQLVDMVDTCRYL